MTDRYIVLCKNTGMTGNHAAAKGLGAKKIMATGMFTWNRLKNAPYTGKDKLW